MDIWTLIGWIAATAGTIYPMFQVMKSIKHKNAFGVSKKFLFTWFIDKFFTLLLMIHLLSAPMIIKYSFGLICVAIIIYFKFWGDGEKPNL